MLFWFGEIEQISIYPFGLEILIVIHFEFDPIFLSQFFLKSNPCHDNKFLLFVICYLLFVIVICYLLLLFVIVMDIGPEKSNLVQVSELEVMDSDSLAQL